MAQSGSQLRSLAICTSRAIRSSHQQWCRRVNTSKPQRCQQSQLSYRTYQQPSAQQCSTRRPQRSQPAWRPGATIRRQCRAFSVSTAQQHNELVPPKKGEERHVTFITKEGESFTFEVGDGDNLLDIAQANDLEMEGACGGSCACSTCHVIVQGEEDYDKMEEPSDDENDMLDLAFGLTETSRLGCQVQMSKELDGITVKLPSMTRNMQASDFAEKEKKG